MVDVEEQNKHEIKLDFRASSEACSADGISYGGESVSHSFLASVCALTMIISLYLNLVDCRLVSIFMSMWNVEYGASRWDYW